MGWTDVFPVFTEEMVDDFDAQASPEERAELEEWYGTERVLNAQPEKLDIVSVSLFWKNVRQHDGDLPSPTREILKNAQEMGFAKRFNPWDHYVRPLLERVPEIRRKHPEAVVRVYLAKDMEFLADELAEVGIEVHVMKSSSIRFAPGGLWRFLPFSEAGKRVTVTDVDRLNELESDLLRSLTMQQAEVGAWRVPVPTDLTNDRKVCYLPFMGCQFGVMGGLIDARHLLDAFTWHAIRGKIDPVVLYPSCGPLEIQSNKWPSYGFDEFFMMVAAYPRLAQHGMLTFVPTFAKSQLLTLDIEYVTWGNPSSELIYFPIDECCGVSRDVSPGRVTAMLEEPADVTMSASLQGAVEDVSEEEEGLSAEPVVAFLYLTRGELNHPEIWIDYFSHASPERHRIHAHTKDSFLLGSDSILLKGQVDEKIETRWGCISLVRATIAMLRAAMKDKACTHFVLVSESCVPVRPFHELTHSLLLDPRSRVRFQPWQEVRKANILKAQRFENLPGIRKELAHFQDQWMCLNRQDTELIVSQDRTSSFEDVSAPDEGYFATVLAAAGRPPLQALANRPITWTEWEEGQAHPKEFRRVSGRIAAQITDSGCFFARKFPAGSDIGRWGLHREISTPPPFAIT